MQVTIASKTKIFSLYITVVASPDNNHINAQTKPPKYCLHGQINCRQRKYASLQNLHDFMKGHPDSVEVMGGYCIPHGLKCLTVISPFDTWLTRPFDGSFPTLSCVVSSNVLSNNGLKKRKSYTNS